MKKILICLLTVCMLLTLFTVAASATTEPAAEVTVGEETFTFDNVLDAFKKAAENKDSTMKMLRSVGIQNDKHEIGGTYTLDLNGYSIYLYAPLKVSTGTVTVVSTTAGGTFQANNCVGLLLMGGSLKLDSVIFTANADYAIRNEGTGTVYVYGNSMIGYGIYAAFAGTVCGNNGAAENAVSYTGQYTIPVYCGWKVSENTPAVIGAPEGKFVAKNFDANNYVMYHNNGNLGFAKIAYGSWIVIGLLFAAAVALFVVTIVSTKNFKKRMKEEAIKDRKYASMNLVSDLVVPLEYLTRACEFQTPNAEMNNFLIGFKMIATQLTEVLESDGLKVMDVKLGDEFDPTIHHAMATEAVEGTEKNKVLQVISKGYIYKDRIIKPAMVKVSE